MNFTEDERIEVLMMIRFGDINMMHEIVCILINKTQLKPSSKLQSIVSRIENKFRKISLKQYLHRL